MKQLENLLTDLNPEEIKTLSGLLTLIKTQKKTANKSLVEFHSEYMSYAKSIYSDKYCRSIDLCFKHIINYFGEQASLESISLREAEKFVSYKQASSPKGIKVYIRTLKAIFNKAIDWEYISYNVFAKVKVQKTQETRPAFIGRQEVDCILEKATSQVLKNLILFTFYTGLRLSEVVNLKWKHISLVDRSVTVGDEDSMTKSRKQRMIPLCDEIEGILSSMHSIDVKSEDYVFPKSNSFPYTAEYVSKKFKSLCRKAGISEDIHFHSLRHSFASNLVQRDVNLYVVKELLGHSSITVTEVYSHLNTASLKNAISKLNAA